MASGHVYRANRPNTWPLRPMLQSEDSSCQPGAVHTWPFAEVVPQTPMSEMHGTSTNPASRHCRDKVTR
jgi:hypothetical protein